MLRVFLNSFNIGLESLKPTTCPKLGVLVQNLYSVSTLKENWIVIQKSR